MLYWTYRTKTLSNPSPKRPTSPRWLLFLLVALCFHGYIAGAKAASALDSVAIVVGQSPSLVCPGSPATYTVRVTRTGNGGLNVALSIPDLPGVSASFVPNPVVFSGNTLTMDSTLTLPPSATFAGGTHNFTVSATDGVITRTAPGTLVVDNVSPVANCKAATVPLDATGAGTLLATAINDNSSDNCAVTVVEISKDGTTFSSSLSYGCADLGNGNTVTLRVKDAAGNAATCTDRESVVEASGREAGCKAATVPLDATGAGTLLATAINDNSSDNCADRKSVVQRKGT